MDRFTLISDMSLDPSLFFFLIARIRLSIYHVYACIRSFSFMFGESHLLFLYNILLNGYPCSLSLEKKKLDEI
jgi:hypothetical protein